MTRLAARLAELTAQVEAAVRDSGLTDAELVTVSNNGADFISSRSQAAGAVIVYPFPKASLPAPRRIHRVSWTLAVVAAGKPVAALSRCDDLLEALTAAGVVRWGAEPAAIDPQDFRSSDDPQSPPIPGWAITITEEHFQ